MKKLLIPISLFNFKTNKILNIISGIKKLSDIGFKLYVDKKLPSNIQEIFLNEEIKIEFKPSKSELNSILILKYDAKSGKIIFNKKKFNSLYEFANSLDKQNRTFVNERFTKETKIRVSINLDGNGKSKIKTGIGFFDHMLKQIARHSNIDLDINANGDLWVDEHHTVEDVGITLGETISGALGNKKGIQRYGFAVPMDDAIALCSIDLGGRSSLIFKCKFHREKVGDFPTELVKEFFRGIAQGLKANIFFQVKGENEHHKIEAMFKAFAKALNEACRIDERNKGLLPTTKGLI